jgi:ADP-heptose:LPS heptosyltransferase
VKQILLIQTAFLGDVILATPVISELKRLFPSAEIDVVVRKGNEQLLNNNPNIRSVFAFDKKKGKLKALKSIVQEVRKTKYDEVINLQRFGSSGIITWLAKAKVKTGFQKNPFSFCYTHKIKHQIGNGKHEIQRNLLCIEHLGKVEFSKPSIFPSLADFEKVKEYKKNKYFVCAPASVWFTKQLPIAKWVELIQNLPIETTVYLVGAPTDVELCQQIQNQTKNHDVQILAGKLSLLESAALMKDAQRNYVNDSGPLHICSAMNAPVTAFFCSTTPLFGFGPVSDDSKVLETSDKLACKPCGLHGFKACPKSHFSCGNIDVTL